MLGYLGIGHRIATEAALLGLDADVAHRLLRRALEVTVAVGRNAHHRPFGNVKHSVVYLKLSAARKNDVILLILLVAVEKRHSRPRQECPERDFARRSARRILNELLALKPTQ